MTQHKLQNNRFELKYVIDEQRARAMRDYIRGYVEPDEHVQDLRNCSYPVHSLYLDAPTLVLYRQTTRGLKNRFKLRIRFYDDLPGHPAFLEIKRRLNDAIRKERAAITRAGVDRLLKGRPLGPADLIPANGNGRAGGVLERFCHLVEELGAQPAAHVSYVREAYVSPGSEQLRVTYDRQIQGATFDWRIGLSPPTAGVAANVHGVVLELKFVDRFPHWMRDLVWAFDLQRRSMPKYVHCVEALGLRPGCWLEAQANCRVAGTLSAPSRSSGTRTVPAALTTAEGCVANLTESLWQRTGS